MRYSATGGSVVCEELTEPSVCSTFPTSVRCSVEGFNFGELRQRNVNGGSSEDLVASLIRDDDSIGKEKEDCVKQMSPMEKPIKNESERERSVLTKSETVESVDWKRIMEEDPNCEYSILSALLCMQHCSYLLVMINQKLSYVRKLN